MRRFGRLYRPLDVTRARYSVPLGTCTATTVAVVMGCPSLLATVPVSAAVVTPCAAATVDAKRRKAGARVQRNTARRMTSLRCSGFFAEGLNAVTLQVGATASRSVHLFVQQAVWIPPHSDCEE